MPCSVLLAELYYIAFFTEEERPGLLCTPHFRPGTKRKVEEVNVYGVVDIAAVNLHFRPSVCSSIHVPESTGYRSHRIGDG